VRQDERVLNEFVNRIRMLLWSAAALGLAIACLVLVVVTAASAALTIVWVGVPMLFAMIMVTRAFAAVHRRYAGPLVGRVIEAPYLQSAGGNLFTRMRGLFADPATRRDALWLFVNATAGLALTLAAFVMSVLGLIFWWLPAGLLVRAHAQLCAALLTTSEKSRLALRVQHLTASRAETVDTQAAELRRIERDLHDGAQARLVALGMNLALAEEQLAHDPEAARALLGEARSASSDALAELRALVRGIHPPVLADRGLDGAVQALALACPAPVQVELDLPGRLPDPVESAAYFAIAEALTNVVKHAGAVAASVRVSYVDAALVIVVRDDGAGGADPADGTGLRGIEQRLSAFDGTLSVTSPPGGPTELAMVLPCVLSSPKTSPSSGTA
jgi:signal transduction histidine kinase